MLLTFFFKDNSYSIAKVISKYLFLPMTLLLFGVEHREFFLLDRSEKVVGNWCCQKRSLSMNIINLIYNNTTEL